MGYYLDIYRACDGCRYILYDCYGGTPTWCMLMIVEDNQ